MNSQRRGNQLLVKYLTKYILFNIEVKYIIFYSESIMTSIFYKNNENIGMVYLDSFKDITRTGTLDNI